MDTLYVLHGFMGTAKTHFSNQISFLKESYHIVALDLPGHGESDYGAAEDYVEETINWLIGHLKETGSGYLLGLSLGASIAIHTAIREPSLVNGIILTGYTPFVPKQMKSLLENQYNYFLNIENNDKEIAAHFKDLHGERWRDTIQKVLHCMTYQYPEVTGDQMSELMVPTLLLNGSNELHEVEGSAWMKKQKGDLHLGLIPNTGHTPNIDKPHIFNELLKDFFKGLEERKGECHGTESSI
ncbi:alpha/beta fold hydrolase [Rossellomorea aquimaris]|uniref:alpha/beta fold hydrolase n=1 Tax=Rossellomorea aquimaris TaxID=189382 RepID=UPI0007D0A1F8|nr:alpha/beta hydrolase [Rossellomorea aquimaris]